MPRANEGSDVTTARDEGAGPVEIGTARSRTVKELAKHILPEPLWRGLWRVKNAIATPVRVQRFMDAAGYNVADKADYYSPMSSVPELRASMRRWFKPSALVGISYDLER